MTVRWKEVKAQMVMGGTLHTFNSRVSGSNPIASSIYSLVGVFSGLRFITEPPPPKPRPFDAQICSIHPAVIRDVS